MSITKLLRNPSHSFSISLMNLLIIYFLYYAISVEMIGLYFKQGYSDWLYMKLITDTILFGIFTIFVFYIEICQVVRLKNKFIVTDLINAQYETTVLDKKIIETINIHLDGKIGLNVIKKDKDKSAFIKGAYVINETIDALLMMNEIIKGNPALHTVQYVIGESIHLKPFHKRLQKIGIHSYKMTLSSNFLFTFLLMWVYNIRVYGKLYPRFKGVFSCYRFQIPIEWLRDPINREKLMAFKRDKASVSH